MTTVAQFIAAKKAKGTERTRLLNQIIQDNSALADSYAVQFCRQWGLEHLLEDMRQSARLAMIKAIDSYKPFKGRKKSWPGTKGEKHFANWYWFVCRDELQRCARLAGDDVHPQTKSNRKKPRVKFIEIADCYSSSVSMGASGIQSPNGFAAILGAGGNQQICAAIDGLPLLEKTIVMALANGESSKELAKKYGVDMTEMVNRIKEKLL